jgi:MFS family permease
MVASLAGTAIEFYEFYIYGTAAALVLGELFFPQGAAGTKSLAALATFGIAFFARPIGSFIFGHFGDRLGRKSTLVGSVLFMGISTTLIGVLPGYASAGVVAPVLLCILRLGQGIGFGGEWGGAALLATENAPRHRHTWLGMFPQLGPSLGFLLSNGLFLLLFLLLTSRQFAAWGWRITIVMLPGGAGDVGVERDGDVRHDDNFVVWTRAQWTAKGYAVLIPDTIDRANLRGVRSSPAYARLVDNRVRFAHAQIQGPVFLRGTSQGSIAAMNGAAHVAPGAIAGVVLTESVSRMGGSHETVFSADPHYVTAPALVVANRDDACDVASPEDAPRIAAAMSRSRDVRILQVAGVITQSRRACGSLPPHGYYGIEATVIDQISQWMQAHA